MNFKLTLILIFALTIALVLSAKASAEKILVGVVNYPPHINQGEPLENNATTQYLNTILKKIYTDVDFIKLPLKRALIELKKGKIDLLYPLNDDMADISYLSKPLFYTVPGLCFKKENFIPMLSATHLFKKMIIGIPAGVEVVSTLKEAKAHLRIIEGSGTINRGVNMLLGDRIDALYHPSPAQIYHFSNPLSKSIACSYFYGYSSGVSIASSPTMPPAQYQRINRAYIGALKNKSYEFSIAEQP